MTEASDDTKLIQELAKHYGLGEQYHDYRGELRIFSAAARRGILQAMGADLAARDVAYATPPAYDREHQIVPPAVVCVQGEVQCDLHFLNVLTPQQTVRCLIHMESGQELQLQFTVSELQQFDNARYRVPLSADLPLGYHQLTVQVIDGREPRSSVHCQLIVAPSRCYEPASIVSGQRLWGLSIQLYTLRSKNNWGIGDFADLKALILAAASQGCALIGLNPLHALRPADAAHISPYSPSSREFFNVMYIAVPAVAEYASCVEAQALVTSQQAQLQTLRDTNCVDYLGVARLKFPALRLLYAEFNRSQLEQNTARAQAFRQYVNAQGEPLRLHALYDALDQYFSIQPGHHWGWRSWPEAFHDPHSATVSEFAKQHAKQVEYFMYLQWLATTQLQEAQRAASGAGMQLGLYGDVAVGVDANGSEVWSNRHLYVQDVAVGAPPDPLALRGQDWGIPPQHPLELSAQAYAPFIRMLRANMQASAALRIDHVMTLYRLWWVPRGFEATEGVYVHYPLDDLIKLVALESVRNRCVVIGEDLGTVADAMRDAMTRFNMYHYKVLFFEKLRDGQFIAPDHYPRNALAVVTTHDLPPFKSWWESADIKLREVLHLYPDEAAIQQVYREREIDRRQLMQALVRAELWNWQAYEPLPPFSHALMRASYLYAALSNAALLVVQPEDLLHMTDPVNVPGTSTQHANWQRKLSADMADVLCDGEVQEVLRALSKARHNENPNA